MRFGQVLLRNVNIGRRDKKSLKNTIHDPTFQYEMAERNQKRKDKRDENRRERRGFFLNLKEYKKNLSQHDIKQMEGRVTMWEINKNDARNSFAMLVAQYRQRGKCGY